MNRFTRRVLAFVSIVGGGLVGAAPTAVASAPDPTPSPAPAATSSSIPNPAPSPDPSVRSGRAPSTADPAGPVLSTPLSPAVPLTGVVRTGRATDVTAGVEVPLAPSAPPHPTPDPAPTPSPAPATPHAATPNGATTNGGASAAAKPPVVSVPAGPPPPGPAAHVTVVGDDLWSIAANHLAETASRPVASLSETEVATYWQQVCDANRTGLQSGDLNLIYPGEAITLPPIGG